MSLRCVTYSSTRQRDLDLKVSLVSDTSTSLGECKSITQQATRKQFRVSVTVVQTQASNICSMCLDTSC